MNPTEQLGYILPTLSALVDRIDPMQLNEPTPCDAFTLHDVLDHMIVLGGSFAYWFRGEEAPEATAPPVYGRVPAAEFREVMDDLLDAVKSPTAMDRIIATPMGEMPGETFARLVAFDGMVHGWDIARSAGLSYELPTCVVDAVDEFARTAITDEMRDGETFKAPKATGVDASPIDRIAAFSGRTV
jgi:uncharacterized protein (TIGR03086 family)